MLWAITYLAIAAFAGSRRTSAQILPNVTLPWGTYQATLYDKEGDFYTFSNVRFGKAPVNALRFQKSVFPDPIADPRRVQSEQGASCYGARLRPASAQSEDFDSAADPPRIIPGLPRHPATEPDAGFNESMPLYDGTGILRAAHAQHQDFILVTGNYRLGAFGWLAGPTMEQHGTPNAGLWDQRLLLDFAHQYLPRLGGDPSNIGVWGESAGGGSILHHLTSTQPPVFNRALIQSPAYLWQWDRTEQGYAASIFRKLTALAKCPSTGAEALGCLQKLSVASLQEFNQAIVLQEFANTGLIPFNPAVDGSLITRLPTTAFVKGAIWKNVTSFVVSHVSDESGNFVPPYITNETTFQQFLNYFLPGDKYTAQRQAINTRYSHISNPWNRAHDVIGDSSFLCNTRYVYDAYNPTSAMYMMQYNFLAMYEAAVHASDLLPTFLNTDVTEDDFYNFFHKIKPKLPRWIVNAILGLEKSLAKQYQPHLASFGATGVPRGSPSWSVAKAGEELGNVMQVKGDISGIFMYNSTTDAQNKKSTCDFWSGIASALEAAATGHTQQQMDGKQQVLKSDL